MDRVLTETNIMSWAHHLSVDVTLGRIEEEQCLAAFTPWFPNSAMPLNRDLLRTTDTPNIRCRLV